MQRKKSIKEDRLPLAGENRIKLSSIAAKKEKANRGLKKDQGGGKGGIFARKKGAV